jgi:hypothetical protein
MKRRTPAACAEESRQTKLIQFFHYFLDNHRYHPDEILEYYTNKFCENEKIISPPKISQYEIGFENKPDKCKTLLQESPIKKKNNKNVFQNTIFMILNMPQFFIASFLLGLELLYKFFVIVFKKLETFFLNVCLKIFLSLHHQL